MGVKALVRIDICPALLVLTGKLGREDRVAINVLWEVEGTSES